MTVSDQLDDVPYAHCSFAEKSGLFTEIAPIVPSGLPDLFPKTTFSCDENARRVPARRGSLYEIPTVDDSGRYRYPTDSDWCVPARFDSVGVRTRRSRPPGPMPMSQLRRRLHTSLVTSKRRTLSGALPFTASGITSDSCDCVRRFRAVSSTMTCWYGSPRATSDSRATTYSRVVA